MFLHAATFSIFPQTAALVRLREAAPDESWTDVAAKFRAEFPRAAARSHRSLAWKFAQERTDSVPIVRTSMYTPEQVGY